MPSVKKHVAKRCLPIDTQVDTVAQAGNLADFLVFDEVAVMPVTIINFWDKYKSETLIAIAVC